MKRTHLLTTLIILLAFNTLTGQNIKSPDQFLQYEIGSSFTYYHQVENYFKHLDENSNMMQIQYYGTTYENNPLMVAIVGSEKNLARLEQIRLSNLTKAGIVNEAVMEDQPAIVWLSYNIHGNEAVSTEAAMVTAFELISNPTCKEWLNNTIVIIDPCLNPDGHYRYVQFYKQRQGFQPNINAFTWEHLEPWPGGRPNHYLFDLNRDWAWQTQQESKHRIKILNDWLPHVHADFHEMGMDDPYYFAPSAEPIHADVTPWQMQFQHMVGKHLGKKFDENNWLYFTGEVFDLFYPSYGDTYPTFNGSIGMTYEQGGSGRAGLAVKNTEGDTITLKKRIDHQHAAGLYTVEISSIKANMLVNEFKKYFDESKRNPKGPYKSYVIKNDNPDKLNKLSGYLTLNGIEFGFGAKNSPKNISGYSYLENKNTTFSIDSADMVISTFQPKSVLLKVLFEPNTMLSDSNTYDITAWALPWARGLNAFASSATLTPASSDSRTLQPKEKIANPLAYAVEWKSLEDARFLSTILQQGIYPRILHEPATYGDVKLERGALIFTRTGYEHLNEGFDSIILIAARDLKRNVHGIQNSFPDKGPSFGSSKLSKSRAPAVGLLCGSGTSSGSVGEVWYFMEQELGYPIQLIEKTYLNSRVLRELDVLILPSLYGGEILNESFTNELKNWVSAGGTLIAIESAVTQIASKETFGIKLKEKPDEKEEDAPFAIKLYSEKDKDYLTKSNPGSIFKMQVDTTHPLAYGYGPVHYLLKNNNNLYASLKGGWNVGIIGKEALTSGFVGHKLAAQMEDFLSIGIENSGRGQIIYFCDNPLFRSFWDSGKLFFANALFMTGN